MIVFEFDYGFSWRPEDEGAMQRTSHALVDGDNVWLIDPIEAGPGIHERIAAAGTVAGVIILLDRHLRDGVTMAHRYDVDLHVPMGAGGDIEDGPVVEYDRIIQVAPFVLMPYRPLGGLWREASLWWPAHRVLVTAECVGAADYYVLPGERLAVHPLVRARPPMHLRSLGPDLVLPGHGDAVTKDAALELRRAVSSSRTKIPLHAAHQVGRLAGWAGSRVRSATGR